MINQIEMIESYNNGIGTNELAKRYGVHRATIQRILINNNIILRKGSPRLKYNVNFFKTYTKESCYWAGFIAADGCIRSDRDTLHIKLKIDDNTHLEKFIKAIKFDGEVKEYETYCTVNVSGKWFVNDLNNNFGITKQKTMTITISKHIPNNMLSHFIRGYFDGDGCITKSVVSSCSITSGSIELLNQLRIIFRDLGVKLKSHNEFPPISKSVAIIYSGKNANIILDWLYKDSNNEIRLDRKYNKYLEFFRS